MGTTRRLAVGALAVTLMLGGWAVIGLMNGEPGAPKAAAVGQAQPVAFRQGVVVAWNPVTLENIIEVDGTQFSNLPVLGVSESQTIKTGSIVGVQVVGDQWAIVGRWVMPSTPEATDAVSMLNSQMFADYVGTLEVCSNATPGDLATFGPSVTVPVGPTGRLAILATAMAVGTGNVVAGTSNSEARMAVWLSGANSYSPTVPTQQGVINVSIFGTYTGTSMGQNGPATIGVIFSGLTPGLTTATLKYQRTVTGAGSVLYGGRSIMAFRL